MSNYEDWLEKVTRDEDTIRRDAEAMWRHYLRTGDEAFLRIANDIRAIANGMTEKRRAAECAHDKRLYTRWLKVAADITKREDEL